MFSALSDKLSSIFSNLQRQKTITESDVKLALSEIRTSLLEADVALPVIKSLLQNIEDEALGVDKIKNVTSGQQIAKLVHDQLVDLLGGDSAKLQTSSLQRPTIYMMVGLQGSGKTTHTVKLAHYLEKQEQKKVLVASLDVYRPAAREQLRDFSANANISSLPIIDHEHNPVLIAKRAIEFAKMQQADIVILDTAGRLHIDDELMHELSAVKKLANPAEILFVADAMAGQDVVNVAETFHEKLSLSGVILSRVDGDTRGGAALSIRHVTGCPIKFSGVGEKFTDLEAFDPKRIAGRVLGMGDVATLVEKAAEVVKQEEAEDMAAKLMKGAFDFNDMLKQIQSMRKMGGLSSIMNYMPGMGQLKQRMENSGMDEGKIKKQEAIIFSMTVSERSKPLSIKASRKKRIAKGAGVSLRDVEKLLKQHAKTNQMMKKMAKLQKSGQLPMDLPDELKGLM
jgi:signal recognition particle subunit SRP54